LLEEYEAILPEGLKMVAPRMIEHNWLVSYRQAELMERALVRLSERLSRKNPLAEGYAELLKHYDGLKGDCASFLGEAKNHQASL
jgi:acyl carrier protein phosphodiesterase